MIENKKSENKYQKYKINSMYDKLEIVCLNFMICVF